ncbi:consortin isoform X2 [Myotis yumanensis]|uniref:consortin isoform X2 n=1 Tax=Myotis yumanensis TaxID=159337 RepID=UPI0038D492FF
MDDSEPPAGKLQIEPQDGHHPGGGVESVGSRLPSASDENENRLDGCGHDRLISSDGAMGNPAASEQDSLNNNAGCTPSCEAAASETSENTACEGPGDGQDFSAKDENLPGKRSPRTKTGTARKIPPGLSSGDSTPLMQEDVLSADAGAVGEEESAEGIANDQPEAPTLPLQSLFSLIRGEVEQLDSRALPLCLHQIAESYFQEEDYEKAMKFIQLERLYHEQLLANLSAIQEQWETKWKTVQPRAATSPRNSEKGFNGEDFERLTKFCATHQDPVLSKSKTAAAETALGRESFAQPAVSEGPQGSGAAAEEPERGTCPGMEPSGESQHREETPGSGPGCGQAARRAAPPRPPAAAGQDRAEEQPLGSAANAPELPAPASQAAGTPRPLAPESAGEDGGPQPAPPEALGAEDPAAPPSSEAVTGPPAAAGSEQAPPAPGGPPAQAPRKDLQLPLPDASEARPADPPAHQELKEPQPEGRLAPEGRGDPDPLISREAEDYLSSLLAGCLRGAEDSPSGEDDPDLLPDLSPDEASYSLQDDPPSPSDGSLSLDDLARRIEVAEVVPAAGLVSILKKRNDAVGDHPAQMQQKPPKRRVRFQEIDDNLDQDEAGSGSCILLVLLCVATVLLSVGGTALYCAFGDLDSPVCTDFADNVDFYYTKLLRGVAELKHWVRLS